MTGVVVAGALANKAGSSGEAWVRMSWVRGFQRLGLDVRFVEELPAEAASRAALAWFDDVIRRFGLEDRATLLVDGDAVSGPALEELVELAPDASLVNISGHLTLPALRDSFRRRVFVDIDPGFTQFWHAQGVPGTWLQGHDLYFTIGELIGTAGCPIPTGGIDWHPLRPPVVLDDWPAVDEAAMDRFTTIASWRGPYGPIEYGGRSYGLKVHEFRNVIPLPARADRTFEVALDIHAADAADLAAVREAGWRIVDPRAVAGDADSFRSYVQGSGAEFSVAQGVYVHTGCGWFSDRTTRYLASGRPALIQDTGFSSLLPTGDGLVGFTNLEEAVAGTADIAARYPEHCAAARRIAEKYFDSDRILGRFCEQAGIQ
jgi:hypothetical protein